MNPLINAPPMGMSAKMHTPIDLVASASSAYWMKTPAQPPIPRQNPRMLAFPLLALLLVALCGTRLHGQQPASVDLTFNADLVSGPNRSSVFSIGVQSDGRILVAGYLWSTTNLANAGVTRLNQDGSIDATFQPVLSGSQIQTVVVQRDQQILIGGWFTYNVAGVTRSNIARLNPDGSPDPSFDPGEAPAVTSIVEQPDGKILVGGSFKSYGGTGRMGLVRLQQDGQLDTGFQSLPSWSIASVSSVAVARNEQILIRGFFSPTSTNSLPGVQRLNADGSVDTTFAPDNWIALTSVAARPDGKVLIATGWSGEDGLMLLNSDGSRDSNFVTDVFGSASSMNPPGVQVIALQADGRILIGGKFTKINGVARANIARLEVDGQLDTSFDAGAGPVSSFDNFSYMVSAMTLLKDGHILVAGPFQTFSGKPRGGMAKLVGDPLPRLEIPTPAGGNFRASVIANLGDVIDVLTSSDLVSWAPWTTLTNELGTVSFTDSNVGTRFYRAVTR